MVVFSLYFIVTATLLVQGLYSAEVTKFEYNANPPQGYQRNAFPQSKDTTEKYVDLKRLESALSEFLRELGLLPNERKREIKEVLAKHKHKFKVRAKFENHVKEKPIFDKWYDWSTCSVTCGKGRSIRWRHCVRNCKGIETEMEEKSCQLPACESRLFGFIKL